MKSFWKQTSKIHQNQHQLFVPRCWNRFATLQDHPLEHVFDVVRLIHHQCHLVTKAIPPLLHAQDLVYNKKWFLVLFRSHKSFIIIIFLKEQVSQSYLFYNFLARRTSITKLPKRMLFGNLTIHPVADKTGVIVCNSKIRFYTPKYILITHLKVNTNDSKTCTHNFAHTMCIYPYVKRKFSWKGSKYR